MYVNELSMGVLVDQPVNAGDIQQVEPIHFVSYTRPGSFQGTPEKLEALADAYVGFQWIFVWNAILTLFLWFFFGMTGGQFGHDDIILLVSFVIISAIATVMSIRPCRRYATGLGRPTPNGIATAVALGMQSWFFFGFLGYSSVMRRTVNEIKRYGIKPGFLGISSAAVAERAAEMRANPTPPPPNPSGASDVLNL